jgi:1-acyl-sn-glycerol-3-phosphate acyltransferase
MKPYHDTVTRTAPPADRFTRRLFRSVCREGPPLPPEVLGCPTMIVSSHRSHMDYILLGIHCHGLGYRNLRFAAGDNLTRMPWIGAKFTSLGAFPICRDRVTGGKYVLGLCEQVAAMLEDGDNVVAFPEGGRSYGGGMLRMKSGLIAASIVAQCRSPHRPHYYLPFAVSYEVLPEVDHLGCLEKARRLRGDDQTWVRRAAGSAFWYGADLTALARLVLSSRSSGRYGSVYIDYGEPLAVGSLVDLRETHAPDSRSVLVAHKADTKRVAEEIGRHIARLYRLLPMHVIAHELRSGRTSRGDITAGIPVVIDALEAQGRNCRSLRALSAADVLEQGTAQLRRLNAVAVRAGDLRAVRAGVIDYCARAVDPPDSRA